MLPLTVLAITSTEAFVWGLWMLVQPAGATMLSCDLGVLLITLAVFLPACWLAHFFQGKPRA
jgi:hypothetical protein